MPLVRVLPVLQPLLLYLGVIFSKPQQRHFNYIQGLICQDHRRTLTGISRHVVDGPAASSRDRFVTSAAWELPALNHQWQRQLRRELRRRPPHGRRIAGRLTDFLIFDDTQHVRTGRCLEGAGYHWVHTDGQTQWSHSLVVGAYRTGDYTLAYSCEPYVRQQDLARLNAARQQHNLRLAPPAQQPLGSFRSKMDLVVAQIEAFRPLCPGHQVFVRFDSGYLNPRFTRAAHKQHLSWCSCLKSNRSLELLHLSLETGEVRSVARLLVGELLAGLVPAALLTQAGVPYAEAAVTPGWESFSVEGRSFRAVSYRGRLARIGLVQVVLVQERYRSGRWSPVVPLVTNRLDLTAPEVVTVYLERWAVEVLIRDGKQHLGLTDCQIERLEGTARRWVLAFLSQALLTLLRLQADAGEVRTASGQPVATVGCTLGEVREFVKQCALVELIRWTCEQAAQGQNATEIALRLGLPA
jgi:DDE superfamily endonuclease